LFAVYGKKIDMRFLLVIAVVCFILSLIAFGAPTLILGLSGEFWVAAGLLAWLLDSFVGVVQVGTKRPSKP
jgi:hypothetical protein